VFNSANFHIGARMWSQALAPMISLDRLVCRPVHGASLEETLGEDSPLATYSTLPSPTLQLKLVFVIERIHDQPATPPNLMRLSLFKP
jgi:hypothetical protein